jgi:ATP/maltotriose-dependent transcriptional regulator MalT
MQGQFERAEAYLHDANEAQEKLGGFTSSVSHQAAHVRLLAGQPELAEVPLRRGIDNLAGMGEGRSLATTTAMLAQAAYAQGHAGEADELCHATAASAARDDIVSQVIWRGVQAKLLADAGRGEEGVELAREAVRIIEPTDLLSHHADALIDLADVLRTCSRADASRDAARAALALCERKGNVVAAQRARVRCTAP